MNLLDKIGRTWLGTETSLLYLEEVHNKILSGDFDKKVFLDEDEDQDDFPRYVKDMVNMVTPNIALVSVEGPMISGSAGFWGSFFGVVGYGDIKSAVIHAREEGAEHIVMDYNTPGGSTLGIDELAEFLSSQENLTSFTGSQATSGGLWLAVAGEKFYSTEMAEVGSVGVIGVVTELTEAFKKEGRTVHVFKSTPLKAAGNPYEKLTAEAAKEIQESIDKTHTFFINHLSKSLGLPEDVVRREIATGQVWFGKEANQKGLTDGISSLEEIVSLAMSSRNEDNPIHQNSFNYQRVTDMRNKSVQTPKDVSEEESADTNVADPTKDTVENIAAAAAAAGADVQAAVESQVADEPETEEAEDQVEDEATTEAEDAGTDGSEAAATNFSAIDQIVDLKVDLKEANNKIIKMESEHNGMKEVLVAVIQRSSVALGSPAPNKEVLMSTDVSAMLQQYAQLTSQLNERFGAGTQISADVEENQEDVDAAGKQMSDVLVQLAQFK